MIPKKHEKSNVGNINRLRFSNSSNYIVSKNNPEFYVSPSSYEEKTNDSMATFIRNMATYVTKEPSMRRNMFNVLWQSEQVIIFWRLTDARVLRQGYFCWTQLFSDIEHEPEVFWQLLTHNFSLRNDLWYCFQNMKVKHLSMRYYVFYIKMEFKVYHYLCQNSHENSYKT